MERQESAPDDSEQLTLQIVMSHLERIETEMAGLRDVVERNTSTVERDRRESSAERRVITKGLGIIQEQNNFYDVQGVHAFNRISGKLNGLSELIRFLFMRGTPNDHVAPEWPIDNLAEAKPFERVPQLSEPATTE